MAAPGVDSDVTGVTLALTLTLPPQVTTRITGGGPKPNGERTLPPQVTTRITAVAQNLEESARGAQGALMQWRAQLDEGRLDADSRDNSWLALVRGGSCPV